MPLEWHNNKNSLFYLFSSDLHQIEVLEKFLEIISQRFLVKLQTDTVLDQSL